MTNYVEQRTKELLEDLTNYLATLPPLNSKVICTRTGFVFDLHAIWPSAKISLAFNEPGHQVSYQVISPKTFKKEYVAVSKKVAKIFSDTIKDFTQEELTEALTEMKHSEEEE